MEIGFNAATAFVMPFYSLMLFAPRRRITARLLASPVLLVPLGVLYLVLLVKSWQPDTLSLMFATHNNFMPELSGICRMFNRVGTVSSAWVHLLMADLVVAIKVFSECVAVSTTPPNSTSGAASPADGDGTRDDRDAERNQTGRQLYPHRLSVTLCFLFGPLGYVSHVLTKILCDWWRRRRRTTGAGRSSP